MRVTNPDVLPPISRWQLQLFLKYIRWYLSRNFHALHLLQLGTPELVEDRPVLVCVNHPSWWDPLLCLYLSNRFFGDRSNYGPIATAGAEKYKFFERIGFFGIDPQTRSGAERFLRMGEQCLSSAKNALWVTPQGEFVDVRRRPVVIAKGVGHLARKIAGTSRPLAMLPIAYEYAFWEERYAEAFACIGEPVFVEGQRTPGEWTQCFASALERTQDALSGHVQARNRGVFESLLAGRSGIGGVYDIWRAAKARLMGKKFIAAHGNTEQGSV